MKQLGNQDAGFVYNETPNTPMHIAGLGIYDPSSAPNGRLGHKDIIKYVQDRIHLAPIFRYKYVEVPFGLDKPYWIEDPDFDAEFHIRHVALPKPGDWRQLCILTSRLSSRPLDFERPLWEAYIIEGLDNIEGLPKDSFAILVKVHHSIVDGTSGQSVFAAFHDLAPDAVPTPPEKPLTIERKPTTAELLGRALPNMISRPFSQTGAFYRKAPNLIKGAIKLYRGEMKSGAQLKVPPTRFNRSISPHRVFEGAVFSLDDVKAIKNTVSHSTTVNDVMLAVMAGGMRKYLLKHKELPADALCAMIPQDIRTEKTKNDQGNQVGGMFASLHTNIEDPIERLLAIHESTDQAKLVADELDTASIIQNYMGGFFNPNMGRGFNRILQSSKVMERFGPWACNTLATNVPGPNFPLYHAGAKMVSYWGIPPLTDCLGLSHAIFSYCGSISLSVLACREMMPDPEFYIQCINESYADIQSAATSLKNSQEIRSATKEEEEAAATKAAKKASSAKQPTEKSTSRSSPIKSTETVAQHTSTTKKITRPTRPAPSSTASIKKESLLMMDIESDMKPTVSSKKKSAMKAVN